MSEENELRVARVEECIMENGYDILSLILLTKLLLTGAVHSN